MCYSESLLKQAQTTYESTVVITGLVKLKGWFCKSSDVITVVKGTNRHNTQRTPVFPKFAPKKRDSIKIVYIVELR